MEDLTYTPYIKDIDKGLLKEGHFLLKKIHLNISKKNVAFLRFILADKTGHLPGIYFGSLSDLKKIQTSLQEGSIIKVSGIIEEYQEVLQIKILKIDKSQKKESELSRFWKRTPHDRRKLYRKLKFHLEKIKNSSLKELCFSFLIDRSFMKLFLEAPASRYIHHAYIGGLLEHTLHVVQLVDAYTKIFPQADRDLLVAGAFLHDIGKIDEYNLLLSIDYSSAAKLKGHTLLSYDRLVSKLNKIDIESNLRIKIEHIILSHQGKKIWGAIEEPKFLEAYLVHSADSTDSSQFIFSNAKKIMKAENEGSPYWSEFISYLGRDIYLS